MSGIFKFIGFVIIAFTSWLMLQGCSSQEPSALETALALAGSNRSELEAVLDHYANDSLKSEAARFLIENMPGHFSYADTARVNVFYDDLDSLLVDMKGRPYAEIADSVKALYDRHDVATFRTVEDVRVISADFLIDNIDRAFEQWQNRPWCRSLDFDSFCEYILPYKVAETQALIPWRQEFEAIVADSLARMECCSLYRISAFQAAEFVNNCLKNEFCRDPDDQAMPPMYYRPLTRLRVPYSTCEELCQSGLNIFRAAGIPVAIDYVPLWGYGNRGHSWGVVRAPNGKDMPLVPVHMSPYTVHKVNETVSKAYRRTYARNPELVALNDGKRFAPETFRNIFQRDITRQYADTKDIAIDADVDDGDYVYLCTSTRSYWMPVAFAVVKDGSAEFSDVGKGCIYQLVKYGADGVQYPLGEPIKVDWDGNIERMTADVSKPVSATLYRKGPLLEYAWRLAVMMERGHFEASNSPDFRNYVTVGHVATPADQAGEINVADSIGEYRYWRYIQRGDSARCYLGELAFLNEERDLTREGNVIGNFNKTEKGSLGDGNRAFDGDVLTPVSFTRHGEAWVGLDFGKPVRIDMIRYVPRSDGDMIEPGDEYEMRYWQAGQWHSLGRKTAETVSLVYDNIPSGAVYILIDLTKGQSERIFLLDGNGRQEWW